MAILDFLDCFFSTEKGGWLFYSKVVRQRYIFYWQKQWFLAGHRWSVRLLLLLPPAGVKNRSKLSFEWQAQHWVQVICLMLKEVTSLMVKSTRRETPLMMGIWVSSSNFFPFVTLSRSMLSKICTRRVHGSISSPEIRPPSPKNNDRVSNWHCWCALFWFTSVKASNRVKV